jgi:hypothetical protein
MQTGKQPLAAAFPLEAGAVQWCSRDPRALRSHEQWLQAMKGSCGRSAQTAWSQLHQIQSEHAAAAERCLVRVVRHAKGHLGLLSTGSTESDLDLLVQMTGYYEPHQQNWSWMQPIHWERMQTYYTALQVVQLPSDHSLRVLRRLQ